MKKLIYLLLIFPLLIQAQNASIQDCLGAIPVCDRIYVEELSPIGFGDVNDINGAINCNPIEQNSIWYIFTVNQSGQFGFLLTPNDPNDDYDWALFNITNGTCEDIRDDFSLLVSCNSAGSDGCHGATGANGDSEFTHQGSNCDNFPPSLFAGFSPFNDLVDVQAGDTYVLFINNFTGSTNGYTLDFGLSEDIGIFDDTDPVLETVALTDACNGQEISLEFSEYIQCGSLSAANFELSGAGGPFNLSLSSVNCDAGGNYSKSFFLNVVPPLVQDNYTLTMQVNGLSDALDLCDNPAGTASFNLAGPGQVPDLDLGNDTTLCTGNSLVLDAGPLSGSYLWSDGSTGPTLEVSNAGTYFVEVNTGCSTTSDTIDVNFIPGPLLDLGPDTTLCASESLVLDATGLGATYQWSDGSSNATLTITQAGTYSVTVTSDCGISEDTVTITLSEPVSATLPAQVFLCEGDSISVSVATSGATYLWQDGSTQPDYTIRKAGNFAVTVTTACEVVNLSTEALTEGAAVTIDLGNDTTLCTGQQLLLDLTGRGSAFFWQDGSTASTFTVTTPGDYAVTVSSSCDQQEDAIRVDFADAVVLSLPDTSLCPGETLTWDLSMAGATYTWSDGSTGPAFSPTSPGQYAVTVSTPCETLELSAEVQIGEALPDFDLGNDTTLCEGGQLLFDLALPNVTYTWQDGTTGSAYTIDQSGDYNLTIANDCGSATDVISVLIAEPIVLDLLSDTVLCPGESLLVDAGDANATYYTWQDGSTDPEYLISQAGTYTVVAGNDCEEVSAQIEVAECTQCKVFIPNSFSPNNDGVNDEFRPFSNCDMLDFHLMVFDRWGTQLFDSRDPETGWDGRSKGQYLKTGVYLYLVTYTLQEDQTARQLKQTGEVSVVK